MKSCKTYFSLSHVAGRKRKKANKKLKKATRLASVRTQRPPGFFLEGESVFTVGPLKLSCIIVLIGVARAFAVDHHYSVAVTVYSVL